MEISRSLERPGRRPLGHLIWLNSEKTTSGIFCISCPSSHFYFQKLKDTLLFQSSALVRSCWLGCYFPWCCRSPSYRGSFPDTSHQPGGGYTPTSLDHTRLHILLGFHSVSVLSKLFYYTDGGCCNSVCMKGCFAKLYRSWISAICVSSQINILKQSLRSSSLILRRKSQFWMLLLKSCSVIVTAFFLQHRWLQ